jgi:hypothetical protein
VSCCQVVDARRNNNDSRWVAKQGGEEQVWNEVADALTTRGWWGRTASAVITTYHKQNMHLPGWSISNVKASARKITTPRSADHHQRFPALGSINNPHQQQPLTTADGDGNWMDLSGQHGLETCVIGHACVHVHTGPGAGGSAEPGTRGSSEVHSPSLPHPHSGAHRRLLREQLSHLSLTDLVLRTIDQGAARPQRAVKRKPKDANSDYSDEDEEGGAGGSAEPGTRGSSEVHSPSLPHPHSGAHRRLLREQLSQLLGR